MPHPSLSAPLEHFSRWCIPWSEVLWRSKHTLAKAYSDDLRRKILEAQDRGEGSLRELASRFGVSCPWAWKISWQRRRTGQIERAEQRYGPVRKVTGVAESHLRSWIRQQPELTLAELQQRLRRTMRLQVSIGRLWEVLRDLQLPLKKSRSTLKSRTGRKTGSAARRGRSRAS